MIVRATTVWGFLILLVALCMTQPVFAESDLESFKTKITARKIG